MPSTIGIVASGEDVLNDAVFWVDAGRSSVVSGALSNLGTGGSALNAVFGNSTGVDSFDPALLTHTGTNYLHLPGVNGNYASTPDAVALDIAGDIDISACVQAEKWSGAAATQVLISKLVTGSTSYELALLAAGQLRLIVSPDGTTQKIVTSTVVTGVADNTAKFVRVTLDVDNGAGGYDVRFYLSDDGSAWTQLGATVTNVGVTSIFVSTAQLAVGSRSDAAFPFAGRVLSATVRNGIGGSTVFDANFTTGITSGGQTTFTESSANAATVTINRSTSGRKSVAVTRPILLFGTDDYLEVADNDLLDFGASDSFTVAWIGRQWGNTAGSFRSMIVKMPNLGSTAGWAVMGSSSEQQLQFRTRDASSQVVAPPLTATAGTNLVVVATRSGTTHRLHMAQNGGTVSSATITSTALDLTNSAVVRMGANTTAGQVWEGELVAAAVWRRALNANEIATIVARYT